MAKKSKAEQKATTEDQGQQPQAPDSPARVITKTAVMPASSWFFNFYNLMFWAIVIRFGFMFLNEVFDITTDVDYHVYTEGARELLKPNGNPYHRFTYRYTPLVAYLMLPNLQVPFFGKILWNLFDLVSIVYMDLFLRRLPIDSATRYKALSFWMLNPYMAYINGRGSCESLSLFLMAAMLYHLRLAWERKAETFNVFLAAIFYGLLVHFRLYPVIYGLTIYIWINRERVFPRFNVILFGIVSIGLNVGLVAFFYKLFGQIFLDECFLYHLKRKDPRHNYSIFWLITVYDYFVPEGEIPFPQLGKVLLGGRLLLIAIVAVVFWKRKILAMTIQTFIFTTFNTVYTAQYAIWEIQLLPYLLADSDCFNKKKKLTFWLLIAIWFINLEVWAYFSGKFEHRGENAQYWMHFANLGYFLIRVLFIHFVVENRKDYIEM